MSEEDNNENKNEEELIKINEYYHDQLEKALSIFHILEDLELKHNIELPKGLNEKITDFVTNFTFKYHD